MAEFERDLIRDRTKAGLAAAGVRGRMGGKPKGLNKEEQSKAHAAKALYNKKDKSVAEIGKVLSISRCNSIPVYQGRRPKTLARNVK